VKKALLWVGISVAIFVVAVIVTFLVLTYIEPEPTATSQIDLVPNGVDPKVLEEKKAEINSLNLTILSLKDSLNIQTMRIDSLQEQIQFRDGIIREYTRTVANLNDQVKTLNQRALSVKELAKTFETMKVEDMKPILAQMDDPTVLDLYTNINSRNRKNLLMALSTSRAAQLAQKIANLSGS
jgi:flagellar motility protein MotE (MotC chaperone)